MKFQTLHSKLDGALELILKKREDEKKMKNTQKKNITRSYHLLTKVESAGKCRRVTAAIDVIVTLSRKSL